jgi:hypothetical protein
VVRSRACAVSNPEVRFWLHPRRGDDAAPQDEDGNLVRKAGVMRVVIADGDVRPDDVTGIELPQAPHRPVAAGVTRRNNN